VGAAAQVEGDDADHDQRRADQLQRGGGLAERDDPDEAYASSSLQSPTQRS